MPPPVITSVTPVAGPIAGAVEVTIFGTDLSSATSVTFGGTEVTSIDENSATRIAVTIAAHALGLVDVVVTTAGGSDTAVNAYDYLDPAITSISPNVGPSAGGQSVTITGTDLDDAASVTFGGVVALDTFDDAHNTTLPDHISDSGETWTKVSPAGNIVINAVFPPDPPAARQSGSNQNQEFLWSAEGANGILKCHFFNDTGGNTASCGLFFRRNPSTPTEKWFIVLESSVGNPDSTLRLTSQGGGGVNESVIIVGKLQGDCRVELSGPEIKIYFDNILKISVNSAHSQNEVGLGLMRSTFGGGGGLEEWDDLSFVDGGEITSNTTTQIVVTTPAGPVGLVDVVVANPGGDTTEADGYTYLGGAPTGGLLQLEKEFLL